MDDSRCVRSGGNVLRTGWKSRAGKNEEGVLITAEDTGVGIPEDAIEKIFESFYTTKEEGTGLGLTIVRKIVRAHGGELNLESTPGAGTRVGHLAAERAERTRQPIRSFLAPSARTGGVASHPIRTPASDTLIET